MGITFRDVGNEIYVATGIDLTDVTSVIIQVERPLKETETYTCTITNTAAGEVMFTKTESMFADPGAYKIRAVVYLTGKLFYGDKADLEIEY